VRVLRAAKASGLRGGRALFAAAWRWLTADPAHVRHLEEMLRQVASPDLSVEDLLSVAGLSGAAGAAPAAQQLLAARVGARGAKAEQPAAAAPAAAAAPPPAGPEAAPPAVPPPPPPPPPASQPSAPIPLPAALQVKAPAGQAQPQQPLPLPQVHADALGAMQMLAAALKGGGLSAESAAAIISTAVARGLPLQAVQMFALVAQSAAAAQSAPVAGDPLAFGGALAGPDADLLQAGQPTEAALRAGEVSAGHSPGNTQVSGRPLSTCPAACGACASGSHAASLLRRRRRRRRRLQARIIP
jgi:hypothetical protein